MSLESNLAPHYRHPLWEPLSTTPKPSTELVRRLEAELVDLPSIRAAGFREPPVRLPSLTELEFGAVECHFFSDSLSLRVDIAPSAVHGLVVVCELFDLCHPAYRPAMGGDRILGPYHLFHEGRPSPEDFPRLMARLDEVLRVGLAVTREFPLAWSEPSFASADLAA